MTINQIAVLAKDLEGSRKAVECGEVALQVAVAEFLSEQHGSARDLAKRMGISVQYVCDLRHGRRKVSAAVLGKLVGMAL